MASASIVPPETLKAILRLVRSYSAPVDHQPSRWNHTLSCQDLHSCALISRTWNLSATPILYGGVSIVWGSKRGKKLIRTIENDPSLALLVRSFDASAYELDHRYNTHGIYEANILSRWEA